MGNSEIIRTDVRCNISFIVYTESLANEKEIEKAIRSKLRNGYNHVVICGIVTIKKITSRAYKVSFVENNELDTTIDEIEDIIRLMTKNIHPQIRKIDSLSVVSWTKEDLMKLYPVRYCKECNSEMIIRDGFKGKFYGCTNFPNCRYSENI